MSTDPDIVIENTGSEIAVEVDGEEITIEGGGQEVIVGVPTSVTGGGLPTPSGNDGFALIEVGSVAAWRSMPYVTETVAVISSLTDISGTPELLRQTGLATIGNIQNGQNIRYGERWFPITESGEPEAYAKYMRIAPASPNEQSGGILFEITDDQVANGASATKVIHQGAGDAHFVSIGGSGVGYDAASFADGSRGFNATNQQIAGAAGDFGNSTFFSGVWGGDGSTFGSTTRPDLGMVFLDRSMGHSIRIRQQDTDVFAFAQFPEFKISEWDLSRDRWVVYNSGDTELSSTVATAGAQTQAAPGIEMIGSWWNAGTPADKSAKLTPLMDGSGNPSLQFAVGDKGSEVVGATISHTGLASIPLITSPGSAGTASESFGNNAIATANNATAGGDGAQATGVDSTAWGKDALATGSQTTAIGKGANTFGALGAIACGWTAQSQADLAISLGWGSSASGVGAVAGGPQSVASGLRSASYGWMAKAQALQALALGTDTDVTAIGGVGVGYNADVSGIGAFCLGRNAAASHARAGALGEDAASTAIDRITLGRVGGSPTQLKDLQVSGSASFFSFAPIAQQTVTGSRGGNAALASLLTAIAATGLLVDGTTA